MEFQYLSDASDHMTPDDIERTPSRFAGHEADEATYVELVIHNGAPRLLFATVCDCGEHESVTIEGRGPHDSYSGCSRCCYVHDSEEEHLAWVMLSSDDTLAVVKRFPELAEDLVNGPKAAEIAECAEAIIKGSASC